MLYFAYGSNMSARRLSARIGPTVRPTIGKLSGHLLKFHKIGRDGSGKCDALCTNISCQSVYGALYELTAHQIELLDRFEDEGRGYLRKPVSVTCKQGKTHPVQAYFAQLIDPDLKPFHWYKEHVLSGAREVGLANEYIQIIANINDIVDPDIMRAQQELGFHNQLCKTQRR